jgi:hypothetical protein
MQPKHEPTNEPQDNQTQLWSDAELRRVTRVFDLLVKVDRRLKKEQGNENKRDTDNASEAT